MRVSRSASSVAVAAKPSALVAIGWLLTAVAGVFALTTVGDSVRAVVVYLVVWLASTTIPGVLWWRVLARPTTLVQELGFGSVTGIALLLLAWVPATLAHRPALMWLLPAGTAAVFIATPSLRRHLWPRRSPHLRTPGRWHAAMMAVCAVAFLRLYVLILELWAIPPATTSSVFQDLWYELSLTQSLRRSVAVDDPAAVGVPLDYHWFSNAHAAATQELSGVGAPEIVMHLWLVAMLVTWMFAVAAATQRILQSSNSDVEKRTWWAGPLAALLAGGLPTAVFLSVPRLPAIDNGFVVTSTSGVLALVVVLAFIGPVLDLLHGLGGRGTWILFVLLVVLAAGAKPSILPVVVCGGLLAGAAQWQLRRRFPVIPAIITVVPLLAIPISATALIGSTGGSRLQLFETLALDPALGLAAGDAVGRPGHGGWLAPALADGSGHVWAVAAGLLAFFLLTESARLIGLLSPIAARSDLGLWWCTGVVGSGFAGLWVLAHPGYSQHYFWRIVISLSVVATVVMIVRLLPPRPHLPVAVVSVAGIAIAAVFALVAPLQVERLPRELVDYSVATRLLPYLAAAATLVAALAVARFCTRRAGRVPAVALIACFLCAAGATVGVFDLQRMAAYNRSEQVVPNPASALYVTAAEQRAALWLNNNSSPNDVVATNVFCAPTRYRAHCRHVSFWVSGLTGRQLFIGAWAYTESNLVAYGRTDALPYQRLDSPWPNRVALSLEAVREPNTAVMSQLSRRGVRWIFADRRATEVSPKLAKFATLEYRNHDVGIYRLDETEKAP